MPEPGHIQLTESMIKALKSEIKRTGKGPYAILKGQKNIPNGLYGSLITCWINGNRKTTNPALYDIAINLWKTAASENDESVEVTSKVLEDLHAHRKRTGVSSKALIKGKNDVPKGLNPDRIENLLRGRFKKFSRQHLEYIFWCWETLPEKIQRIQITQDILKTLKNERERTGIASMALLWGTQKERPEGLSSTLINSWMEDRTKSARQDHIEYVLTKWKKLPDKEDN